MKIILLTLLAFLSLRLDLFTQTSDVNTDLGGGLNLAKAQHKRCLIIYRRGGAELDFDKLMKLIKEEKITIPDSEYVVTEPDMKNRVQCYIYNLINSVFPSLGEDKRAPQLIITDENGLIIAARGGVNTADEYTTFMASASQGKGMEDHDLANALSKVDVSGAVTIKSVKMAGGGTGREFYRYGQKIMEEQVNLPLKDGGTGAYYNLYWPGDDFTSLIAQISIYRSPNGTRILKQGGLQPARGVGLVYIDNDGDGKDDIIGSRRYLDRDQSPRFELDEAYSINSNLEIAPLSAEEFAKEKLSPDLQ